MYHNSKLITMFASFPPRTIHIIKCDGLFCDRLGIFCPNDIRLSDPHGLLSHDSSLFLAERGEGNLSLFLYIIIFYSCQEQWKFVMQGIIVPVQQRPPTKRVLLHLSPLPAILTLTLPAYGIDLHGCTIRYLRSSNKAGNTITGRFNISGREETAGATSYEALIIFLVEKHKEHRRYVAECHKRKRQRNFASWQSRHPEFSFYNCNVTFM